MSARTPESALREAVQGASMTRPYFRVQIAAQNARFAIYALVAVVGGLL